jgi:hypothetical protein
MAFSEQDQAGIVFFDDSALRRVTRSVPKNVRNPASQPIYDVLKRVDRNILLHHFDALECGIRQAEFARKLVERLIAAPFSEEFGQLLAELIAHADRVRLSASDTWDNKSLQPPFRFAKILEILCSAFSARVPAKQEIAMSMNALVKTIRVIGIALRAKFVVVLRL